MLFPQKLTYSTYAGYSTLWKDKKKFVDRRLVRAHTAGDWRMGTDRNGNSVDRDFPTIPLPSTATAGYAIKSTEWLALSRYKRYGQKEIEKK